MKNFYLFLTIFISINLTAQEGGLYFKSFSPDFVEVNSAFQIGATVSFLDNDTEEAELYIIVENNTKLLKVSLRNSDRLFDLKFRKKKFGGYNDKSYVFLLSDSLMTFHSPFQFIFDLQSSATEETEVSFGIIYKMNDRTTAVYSSFETINSDYFIEPTIINFYGVQETAGFSANFSSNSKLRINIEKLEEVDNMLLEFWAIFENSNINFLSVYDTEIQDTVLKLKFDNYQMISADKIISFDSFDENFFSLSNWNHFSIIFSKENSSVKVFGNNNQLLEVPILNNFLSGLVTIDFLSGEKDNYKIDLLKVWDFENSIYKSISNMNYQSYEADSSQLLIDLNFDNSSIFESKSGSHYEFLNIKSAKSNAPIFSRAPEVNVKAYEKFYSIDWITKDVVHAKAFELEKSVDGKTYSKIYPVAADEDPQKVYFFSDEKDVSADIIYYRVKQINKDGSIVFTSPIKIGQGKIEFFSLSQNYPNPFNPLTTISVEMFESIDVDLVVYDIVGNKIEKLHTGLLSQGVHQFSFDGTELPSGIYFYEIKSPFSSQVRKMILAK